MSQDAIPKLPSPEILNKNLASANVMSLQVTLAGNPMEMMDFLWVEMHQPSHLKGIWEIPISEIPVTTTMTKGLQITTAFCDCTRQDYAQFQHVQSTNIRGTSLNKMRVGTGTRCKWWISAISSIQSRHPNTKLPICTTRDQQVPIGMDSYLGDGTGTLDTTTKTS